MSDSIVAATDASPAASSLDITDLALYELQKPFIEPLLRFYRGTNTALDSLFYDVGRLSSELLAKGTEIEAKTATNVPAALQPLRKLNLSALSNPSGSVIVVDANLAPYVTGPFVDMEKFLAFANSSDALRLQTLTITGVGSSALGSVAFAWNVSKALKAPVAAIVPGIGLADLVPQALGGWFGFGVYDALQSATQKFLATFAPSLASIGKELALSTKSRPKAPSGAPEFRTGSAGSDDVHAILLRVPAIKRLVGHSKGALAIENALRSLPGKREDFSVITFGCVVGEEMADAAYRQVLGVLDPLGILNSWGRHPEERTFTHHSTNTMIPMSMDVERLVAQS